MKASLTLVLCLVSSVAFAESTVRVEPATARPGDAVLVTVTGAEREPAGTADGKELTFFRAKRDYQAVFAVPLDADDPIAVKVRGAGKAVEVVLKPHVFPEADVAVEDELANPPPAERARIDADNKAMIEATAAKGHPQFTRAFGRPRGKVTSVFGEWRTFNDGHRSQHLGFDVFATVGTKVRAINTGRVTFVGETFLGGNVVIVAHGAGIASVYMHLNKASVAEGDVVERGAVIGRSGETGRTTGPHLHVAVHVPGGFVDPVRFFRLKLAPAAPATARR